MGVIIETFGWQYSFYLSAVLIALFMIVCYFQFFDCPSKHPRISKKEMDLIEVNQVGVFETKVRFTLFSLFLFKVF